MDTPPSARKAFEQLNILTNKEADYRHFSIYIEQVSEEKNPRGAAILLATNVEVALDYALSKLLNHRHRLLAGAGKPLDSFRNKILLGYALNIYGDGTFLSLEAIRNIRNAFAHARIPIGFDTPEIANVCELINNQPPLTPFVISPGTPTEPGPTPRERFTYVCHRLAHNLGVWTMGGVIPIDRNALKVSFDSRYSEIVATYAPLP
jgi:hypothetical protein